MFGHQSRREFLVNSAVLVASLATPSWAAERWRFTERTRREVEDWSLEDIMAQTVALGPKEDAPEGASLELSPEELEEWVARKVVEKGYDRSGRYRISATNQYYAVPEGKQSCDALLDYCEKAVEFLHSQVKGLEQDRIDWVALKQGDDYHEGYDAKAFLGHSHFELQTITATNKASPEQAMRIVNIRHQQMSYNRTTYQISTGKRVRWHIYIATGPLSLQAPFSEVIPLTTMNRTNLYADQVGEEEAKRMDEAIHEGISFVVSKRFAKKLRVPYGEQIIEESRAIFQNSDVYKYVPSSIAWIEKHGVQRARDMYMEDPDAYKRAITQGIMMRIPPDTEEAFIHSRKPASELSYCLPGLQSPGSLASSGRVVLS